MIANPETILSAITIFRATLFVACLMLAGCDKAPERAVVAPIPDDKESAFVGSSECSGCHKTEYELWQGSHHDLAMQEATTESVLGDFNDIEFNNHGLTSRFFRRDTEYWVETDNASGDVEAFQISYTFGVDPLQQYLIKLPGGRLQALSIAWDSRPTEEGGQRWFHLYPDEPISHDDPLHWTGPAHNWNFMCAECHSTNLKKITRQWTTATLPRGRRSMSHARAATVRGPFTLRGQ